MDWNTTERVGERERVGKVSLIYFQCKRLVDSRLEAQIIIMIINEIEEVQSERVRI